MSDTKIKAPRFKKPNWLRVKLPVGEEYKKVRKTVDKYKLHTICESGNCPNMGECWGAGTATFMILGTCAQEVVHSVPWQQDGRLNMMRRSRCE